MTNVVIVAIIVMAIIGAVDALYLSIASSTIQPVSCSLLEGCKSVLSSSWSRVLGISTALYGVAYYAALVFFALAYWWWRDRMVLLSLFLVASLGLLVSFWLVYLQFFVINALCEYCLISAGITTIIWASTTWFFADYIFNW